MVLPCLGRSGALSCCHGSINCLSWLSSARQTQDSSLRFSSVLPFPGIAALCFRVVPSCLAGLTPPLHHVQRLAIVTLIFAAASAINFIVLLCLLREHRFGECQGCSPAPKLNPSLPTADRADGREPQPSSFSPLVPIHFGSGRKCAQLVHFYFFSCLCSLHRIKTPSKQLIPNGFVRGGARNIPMPSARLIPLPFLGHPWEGIRSAGQASCVGRAFLPGAGQ